MRIRVVDVLDLFTAGLSAEQILQEMPDLEPDDLKACLSFARHWWNGTAVPPKIIWLTCGNSSDAVLQPLFERHLLTAVRWLEAGESLVEIGTP